MKNLRNVSSELDCVGSGSAGIQLHHGSFECKLPDWVGIAKPDIVIALLIAVGAANVAAGTVDFLGDSLAVGNEHFNILRVVADGAGRSSEIVLVNHEEL